MKAYTHVSFIFSGPGKTRMAPDGEFWRYPGYHARGFLPRFLASDVRLNIQQRNNSTYFTISKLPFVFTYNPHLSLTCNFLRFFKSWCVLLGVTLSKLWRKIINKITFSLDTVLVSAINGPRKQAHFQVGGTTKQHLKKIAKITLIPRVSLPPVPCRARMRKNSTLMTYHYSDLGSIL